uniref:Integrase core domain containing protein n=1 Tax=Solanum tuberosum TaxID=4113 RepID=M1CPP5_SOLTU
MAGNSVYDIGSVNSPNHYPMLQACVPSIQASIPQQGIMPMPMFTPGQHQQLLRMLEQTSIDETTGSANMVGISFLPILKWIIDTGASHHMIGDPRYLQHKDLIENAGKVQLPTGDSANVSHIGDCHIGGGDVFRKVLCVPAFKFNLMSVYQVTKNLNCSVTFFPKYCVFQDLSSVKMRVIGEKEDGLYTLSSQSNNEKVTPQRCLAAT